MSLHLHASSGCSGRDSHYELWAKSVKTPVDLTGLHGPEVVTAQLQLSRDNEEVREALGYSALSPLNLWNLAESMPENGAHIRRLGMPAITMLVERCIEPIHVDGVVAPTRREVVERALWVPAGARISKRIPKIAVGLDEHTGIGNVREDLPLLEPGIVRGYPRIVPVLSAPLTVEEQGKYAASDVRVIPVFPSTEEEIVVCGVVHALNGAQQGHLERIFTPTPEFIERQSSSNR
jgi:hypothetical protein